MKELPDASRAAIARVLADLELAVIRVSRQPARIEADGDGGFIYFGQTPVDAIRTAALAALHAIIDVVLDLDLTAADRQQWVTFYQEHILTTYAIDRAPFLKAVREQPWWLRFQQILRRAEHTDTPPIHQQLDRLRLEARWTMERLADEIKIVQRTVEKHLAGTLRPKPGTLTVYEERFSAALNRSIRLTDPTPATRRQRAGKKPVKSR